MLRSCRRAAARAPFGAAAARGSRSWSPRRSPSRQIRCTASTIRSLLVLLPKVRLYSAPAAAAAAFDWCPPASSATSGGTAPARHTCATAATTGGGSGADESLAAFLHLYLSDRTLSILAEKCPELRSLHVEQSYNGTMYERDGGVDSLTDVGVRELLLERLVVHVAPLWVAQLRPRSRAVSGYIGQYGRHYLLQCARCTILLPSIERARVFTSSAELLSCLV